MRIGNLEVYGVIYKIENKINNKVYIGQTIRGFDIRYYCTKNRKGIEAVYHYHKKMLDTRGKCNFHLLKSIEKYGVESFEISKVLDVAFSKEELDIKEKTWIAFYESTNDKYGYNKQEGGVGNIRTYGERNEKSKYKNVQIEEVKRLYCECYTIDKISEITKVDKKDIYNVINFNAWIKTGEKYNPTLYIIKRVKDIRDSIEEESIRRTGLHFNEFVKIHNNNDYLKSLYYDFKYCLEEEEGVKISYYLKYSELVK